MRGAGTTAGRPTHRRAGCHWPRQAGPLDPEPLSTCLDGCLREQATWHPPAAQPEWVGSCAISSLSLLVRPHLAYLLPAWLFAGSGRHASTAMHGHRPCNRPILAMNWPCRQAMPGYRPSGHRPCQAMQWPKPGWFYRISPLSSLFVHSARAGGRGELAGARVGARRQHRHGSERAARARRELNAGWPRSGKTESGWRLGGSAALRRRRQGRKVGKDCDERARASEPSAREGGGKRESE